MDKTRITNANKQHARRSAGAGEIIGRDTMNDLISRQAAIDALYHVDEYNGRSVEAIRKLPPAQPEPKMGKWKRHYCEDGNPDGWQCDKCKEWYYFGQTLPNFCPNCGADMREVTE